MIKFRIVFGLLAAALTAIAQTPQYGYQVVHVYRHDPAAFTEGLEYRAGFLYESTGLKGRSWVRKEKLSKTGEVLQQDRSGLAYILAKESRSSIRNFCSSPGSRTLVSYITSLISI